MFGGGRSPILVLSVLIYTFTNVLLMFIFISGQNTKRESGRKVQVENINAGKVIKNFRNLLIFVTI